MFRKRIHCAQKTFSSDRFLCNIDQNELDGKERFVLFYEKAKT